MKKTNTITFPEPNPEVIIRTSKIGEKYESETRRLKDPLVRMIVSTPGDVLLLQMLVYGKDYFAPASGNGVLVNPKFFAR